MFVVSEIDARVRTDEGGNLVLPTVVRVNKFDDDSVADFARSFTAVVDSGQPIVPIVIDSFGGDVYSLMAMVDIIRASKVPVATVVTGKAMSAGAVLFSCGSEGYRFVGPNATIMIHDVSTGGEPDKKVEEVKADSEETTRINNRMYDVLSENCGKPVGYFMKLANAKHRVDWYLSPQDAIKHNLANHIGVPTLTFAVRAEYKLSLEAQRSISSIETSLPKKRR